MLEAVSAFILEKKKSFASHCSPSPLWKDKKQKCQRKIEIEPNLIIPMLEARPDSELRRCRGVANNT